MMQIIGIAVKELYIKPIGLVRPPLLLLQRLQHFSQPLDLVHIQLIAALTTGVARVVEGV